MSALSFYELARTSHVKRWTIINTTKEQNLAEHQYNVTVIGLELYKQITGETAAALFMAALLFHDSPEIRYGDIPTPGKAFIRMCTTDSDLFGAMDSKIMPELPYVDNLTPIAPGSEYGKLIKLADLIEAAWWIGENGAGHHARTVAAKCWRAVEDFVHLHDLYDAANPVLMDLGLPFVNKSERVTPP